MVCGRSRLGNESQSVEDRRRVQPGIGRAIRGLHSPTHRVGLPICALPALLVGRRKVEQLDRTIEKMRYHSSVLRPFMLYVLSMRTSDANPLMHPIKILRVTYSLAQTETWMTCIVLYHGRIGYTVRPGAAVDVVCANRRLITQNISRIVHVFIPARQEEG